MAKTTNPQGLIKLKTDLIFNNNVKFFEDLSQLQKDLYGPLQEYLSKFEVVNNRFTNSTKNQNLIFGFEQELRTILRTDYKITLDSYVKSLDYIDTYNEQIHSELNNITITPSAFARKFTVDNTIDQLNLGNVVNNALKPVLQRELMSYVTGKQSRHDAGIKLKNALLKDDYLARWSKTIANDSLNLYDGIIQQELVQTFTFDGYHYEGSLIDTSRSQCIHWVRDLNNFIEMSVLRQEVERWKDAKGYDKGVMELTVQSFPRVRGGYGCRHTATPGFKF